MVITPKKGLLPIGTCPITNGPSKYDFQASLFDKKVVQFSIDIREIRNQLEFSQKFNATIHLVGPEDGSGESWIGEVYILDQTNSNNSEKRCFWYNTKTRKGTVMEKAKLWKMV